MARGTRLLSLGVLLAGAAGLAACTGPQARPSVPATTSAAATSGATPSAAANSAAATSAAVSARASSVGRGPSTARVAAARAAALPGPKTLQPFTTAARAGVWHPAGRLVGGRPAVYETSLVPPGGAEPAGIAWMDTGLLSARLYSGSVSPGGGPYRYTAPVSATAARSLVAAFNGGFKMKDAHGGYYTEHRLVDPLVKGAASLVIYANGSVALGAWGYEVSLTRGVVAVRQNLWLLVVNGKPTPRASTRTWRVWGGTCPCGPGLTGTDAQWRSGLGITADGALVYVAGSQLDPVQVADLLVRAGSVRGMELDINPSWPVFATFRPAAARGLAAPSNGTLLSHSFRQPATFFDPAYSRDFITMSARW